MNARHLLTVAASVLALGAPLAAGPALIGGFAVASGKTETQDARNAAREAKAARKALKSGDAQLAVTHAEAAVAFDPMNGELRTLLGESYLFAGRFVSATQALNEALSLDPANGRTALNLALAQIATGEWNTARETLDTHAASIPASDRGLALALAGDPNAAIAVLGEAARQPDADAKTRQNLALSLAMAGHWHQAKAVAAVDLSPDKLDGRIMQWASFSRPQNAYDQVAVLLGVTPVADEGRPERLALVRSMGVEVASAPVMDPVDAYMPGTTTTTPVADAGTETLPADVATADAPRPEITTADANQVVFAPRKEVVQAVPLRVRKAVTVAKATPAVAAPGRAVLRQSNGKWFVQLGAYDSGGVARDAWNRTVRRVGVLEGMTPSSASVTTSAGSFYRLSVGGFDRADAVMLCGKVRAGGGRCFVRTGAGDRIASWAKGEQLASR